MKDDGPLKSAFELAMERLKARDREEGVEEKPLSEDQKEKIAGLRQEAKAKLAELEILHRKNLLQTGHDPAKLAELERNYQADRERVGDRLESAIARARSGG